MAKAKNDGEEKRVYMLDNRLDRFSLTMVASEDVYAKNGSIRTGGTRERNIDFDHGLYETSDQDEVAFLEAHKLFSPEKAGAVGGDRMYRRLDGDDLAFLEKLRSSNVPKKLWHERVRKYREAVDLTETVKG